VGDNTAASSREYYAAATLAVRSLCSESSGGGPVTLVDTDANGIPDSQDNCPTVANPGQEDLNEDGIGAACEPAAP
jgi:hypothetical protein